MNLQEVLEFRRSVRVCIKTRLKNRYTSCEKMFELSTLAPSSSNMQNLRILPYGYLS